MRRWRLPAAFLGVALIAALIWWKSTRSGEGAAGLEVVHRRPGHGIQSRERGDAPAGAVAGWVVDPEGRGVPGATVTVMRQQSRGMAGRELLVRSARAGAGGSFRIARLTPGLYTVAASTPGFTVALRADVEVAAEGSPASVRLRLWRGGVTLSGRVLDAGSGPVPGALVSARGYDPTAQGTHEPRMFQAEANQEGEYRLQLPAGQHELRAQADGYTPALESIDLGADAVKDFLLRPAARISGRVVMSADGNPVAGARVVISNAERSLDHPFEGQTLITDDQGVFRIDTLPAGSFRVKAQKEALVGALGPLTLGETDTVEVELVMSEGLTLKGLVTSAVGQPLPHARIDLGARQKSRMGFTPLGGSFADETGRFVVDGIVPGDYRVQIGHSGFEAHAEDLSITTPVERSFVLSPAAVVSGVVLTAAGLPAANAQLEAFVVRPGGKGEMWMPASTDREGRFRFPDLEAGELRVTARHRYEAVRFGPEPLESGGRKEITVRLAPGAQITGSVSWADGSPAAGVTVLMGEHIRLGALTDAAGSFTIAGLLPGDISLWATANRRDPRTRRPQPDAVTVKLEPGESRTGVKLVVSAR